MNKLDFRTMTVEQVILSEEFKELTVRDLIEIFRCNLSTDTRTGVIKLKLRCKTDDVKRTSYYSNNWSPRFDYMNQQPIGYINPNPCINGNDNDTIDEPDDNDEMDDAEETSSSCNKHEDEEESILIETLNTFKKAIDNVNELSLKIPNEILNDDPESSTDETTAKDTEIDISPFKKIHLSDLKYILEQYYSDKLSLEEIQNVWKVGDTVNLPVLRTPPCYGNIISMNFTIFDFNRKPVGSSFDKSLVTLAVDHYSVSDSGVPVDLTPFIKYIEEYNDTSYFTI